MKIFLTLMIAMIVVLLSQSANAQDVALDAIKVTTNPDGSQDYSVTMQILLIMTVLSFLPSIIIMMTSFTRIVVVLAILRQALGLQTTPSNQIIIGIALFLSFFIMSPVLSEVQDTALTPYMNDEISAKEAFTRAQVPMHKFMLSQTRPTDIALFAEFADEKITDEKNVSMKVLIPAFMVSELKTAFQMGFMLFLPFLVIDLVVSSILMAMGMMMLSPMIVSLPFKIMLFVLVDGWSLIMSTLVSSFGIGA